MPTARKLQRRITAMHDRAAPKFSNGITDVVELVKHLPVAGTNSENLRGAGAKAAIDWRRRVELSLQAQRSLHHSATPFRTFIKHSDAMIALLGRDGTLLYGSAAFAQVLGYAAELGGDEAVELLHPEDKARAAEVFAHMRTRPGQSSIMVLRYRHRNRSYRWLEASGIHVLEEPGVEAVLLSFREIIPGMRDSSVLEASEARFRSMLQGIEAGVVVHGADGQIVAFNAKALELLGVTEAQMTGRAEFDPVWRRVRPDGSVFLEAELPFRRAWIGRQPVRNVILGVKGPATGELIWLTVSANPVLTAHGEIAEVIVTFMDVTARVRAEEALRESEERFSGAFEHAPIGMALVAPDGRWLKVNRGLCDLVGFSEAELLVRTFQSITHPDDLPVDLECVRRLVAGEIGHYQIEKRYVHARGHFVAVSLSVSLVRDGQGQPLYYIAPIQDITARKTADDALRASNNRFKALFEQAAV
ncbi:MAG: PAS domain S-box protein, partial [Opitutaceae bacterium]